MSGSIHPIDRDGALAVEYESFAQRESLKNRAAFARILGHLDELQKQLLLNILRRRGYPALATDEGVAYLAGKLAA